MPGTERVWESWFRAWWAGHWTPDDLPQLRFVIRLHDRVLRGDAKRLGELRQWMDAMGITPKGQQDRRWERPKPPKPQPAWRSSGLRRLRITPDDQDNPYAHLRVTADDLSPRERHNVETYGTPNPSARERFGPRPGDGDR